MSWFCPSRKFSYIMKTRAERRFRHKLQLKRARLVQHGWCDRDVKVWNEAHCDHRIKRGDVKVNPMLAETPRQCSEACCGNPRRHFHEVTIAEVKSDQDFKHQLSELCSGSVET
jgi:hypothetical protein